MSKVFDALQDFEQFEITNGQFRPLASGQLGTAERLGCTPQYVSKILSGKTNFSFKTIAEIERRLGISCMEKAFA